MINETIEVVNSTVGSMPVENTVLTYSQVYNKAWNAAVGRFDRMVLTLGFFLILNLVANVISNYFEDDSIVYWSETVENMSWVVVFIIGLTLCALTFVNPVRVVG